MGRGSGRTGHPMQAGVHPWVVSKGHECERSCRKPRDAELTGSVHTEPEQGRWASRYGWATYTQVPGVQLHLLLQLREQLVVKRLQLGMERKQRSALTYSLREEPNGRGGRSLKKGPVKGAQDAGYPHGREELV